MTNSNNSDIHALVAARLPRAMSSSGLKMLESDPTSWVRKYILKHDTFVQTLPMAIGSAFDAMVKGALCTRLYGASGMVTVKGQACEASDVRDLMIDMGLEAGSYGRDEAIGLGGRVYDHYVKTGALGSLCDALERLGVETVAMETRLVCTIGPEDQCVPVIGYPDLQATGVWEGVAVPLILDWKTTGIAGSLRSGKGVSPKPLYSDQWSAHQKWSRVPHKKIVYPKRVGGLALSGGLDQWSDQVTLYDAMQRTIDATHRAADATLGVIHLSCGVGGDRVTQYAMMIDAEHRAGIVDRFVKAWGALKRGYVPGLSADDLKAALGPLLAGSGIEGLDTGKYGDDDFKRCI